MPRLVEYRTGTLMAEALAALVAAELMEAIEIRGRASLAVPGGTTPARFLRLLSGARIDWRNVSVMPTDDRAVPAASERSNLRLLRETLLQGAASAARVIYVHDENRDVAALEAEIRTILPLDVCVLGMGADGHVASLFPSGDRLGEGLMRDSGKVLVPICAPAAPEPRVSLTMPVLTGARHVHLLFAGADKRAALERAERHGPVEDAPVRAVLARDDLTVHYTEGAA